MRAVFCAKFKVCQMLIVKKSVYCFALTQNRSTDTCGNNFGQHISAVIAKRINPHVIPFLR